MIELDVRKVNVYNSMVAESQELIDKVGGEIKEQIEQMSDEKKDKWISQFGVFEREGEQ